MQQVQRAPHSLIRVVHVDCLRDDLPRGALAVGLVNRVSCTLLLAVQFVRFTLFPGIPLNSEYGPGVMQIRVLKLLNVVTRLVP